MRVAAHNGKPNNKVKSEILTVWRRLWMETDVVAGAGALDDSLLKPEMRKVCIEVKDLGYPPYSIPATQMFMNYDQEIQNVPSVIGPSKSFPGFSSPSFWYAHAIAANNLLMTGCSYYINTIIKDSHGNIIDIITKEEDNTGKTDDRVLGIACVVPNTVIVFNGTIEKYAGTEHPNHKIKIGGVEYPYIYPDVATLKKTILLHEIIHLFGIGDNEKGSNGNIIYDIMCYGYNLSDGAPVIAIDHIKAIQQCTNLE